MTRGQDKYTATEGKVRQGYMYGWSRDITGNTIPTIVHNVETMATRHSSRERQQSILICTLTVNFALSAVVWYRCYIPIHYRYNTPTVFERGRCYNGDQHRHLVLEHFMPPNKGFSPPFKVIPATRLLLKEDLVDHTSKLSIKTA